MYCITLSWNYMLYTTTEWNCQGSNEYYFIFSLESNYQAPEILSQSNIISLLLHNYVPPWIKQNKTLILYKEHKYNLIRSLTIRI